MPDDRDPNLEDVMLIERGAVLEQELSMSQVVPGDLIRLRAGDLIPGDVQVLKSKDLFVSEVSLTGESMPVPKSVLPVDDHQEGVLSAMMNMDREDMAFMGASVVSGTALVVVREIGNKTLFGQLALKLAK